MEKKNIVLAIVLTLVTCGIYGIYWFYTMTEDVHRLVGRRTTADGGMAILYSLVTCGIYSLYWMYKMGEGLTEAKMMRGMMADQNAGLLYLILAVFGLGVISEVLIQSAINDIIYFDQRGNGSYNGPYMPQQPMNPYAQ